MVAKRPVAELQKKAVGAENKNLDQCDEFFDKVVEYLDFVDKFSGQCDKFFDYVVYFVVGTINLTKES